MLLLQTEFNYFYRLFDGVWLSYREKDSDSALLPPKQTPALIVRYVSPKDNPGVVDIDCVCGGHGDGGIALARRARGGVDLHLDLHVVAELLQRQDVLQVV